MENFLTLKSAFFMFLITVVVAQSSLDCDFESGLCSWTQVKSPTDDFDWTRNQGKTSSSSTGPTADHTKGTNAGYYVYIETSHVQVGFTSQLQSPTFTVPTGQTKCLSFWYHMWGYHVETLNVYLKKGATLGNAVWRKTGSQSNQWNLAQINVQAQSNVQIIFEAMSGNGYQGDQALDDITFTDGDCGAATVGTQCNFEDPELCGFSHDGTDDFDWSRHNGATPSAGTGPTNDHTSGTIVGYYMYVEASSPRRQGDKARLLSPIFSGGKDQCVSFWYHMYGDHHIGTLNMYVKPKGTSLDFPQWIQNKDQGNAWKNAQVTVKNATNFQIVFEGIRGDNFQGDLAIDDFDISDGQCSNPGKHLSTPHPSTVTNTTKQSTTHRPLKTEYTTFEGTTTNKTTIPTQFTTAGSALSNNTVTPSIPLNTASPPNTSLTETTVKPAAVTTQASMCHVVPGFLFGANVAKDGVSVGSKVTLKCPSSHEMEVTATCADGGSWSFPAATCVKASGCGGHVTDKKGFIKNPAYVTVSSQTEICDWNFKTFRGQRFQFTILEMYLVDSPGCTKDFVEVQHAATQTPPPVMRFCGNQDVKTFTSATNIARVISNRNGNHTDTGFQIHYKVIGCKEEELPRPVNGYPTNTHYFYKFGYVVKFRCKSGYHFSNGTYTMQVTCGYDGKWKGTNMRCLPNLSEIIVKL